MTLSFRIAHNYFNEKHLLFLKEEMSHGKRQIIWRCYSMCGIFSIAYKKISLILGIPESGVEGYIKLCQKAQQEVKDSVSED